MAMIENEFSPLFMFVKQMDPPATRREKKKDQKEKGQRKYSQKHIRTVEALKEKQKTK